MPARPTADLEIAVPRHDPEIVIPEDELTFVTSRSSGPGGQNVNKVETRVTLLFDLAGSPSLDAEQKERLAARLATRVNKQGILRVVAQKHRTQAANRAAARERFDALLAGALREPRRRRPTRPSAAAKRARLDEKRRRGRVKELRRGPRPELD